jgi:hypothetical protein
VTVRRTHHGNLDAHVAQSSDAICPVSFDWGAPLELEAKFGEELNGGIDVFYHDADVVHTLDRHDATMPPHTKAQLPAETKADFKQYKPCERKPPNRACGRRVNCSDLLCRRRCIVDFHEFQPRFAEFLSVGFYPFLWSLKDHCILIQLRKQK